MRFIPTKFHAPLDYIVGMALIAAPWIFQFSDVTAAAAVSIVLGIGLIAYSLFTDYELGVWKVAPMAVDNLRRAGTRTARAPRRPQQPTRTADRSFLVAGAATLTVPRRGRSSGQRLGGSVRKFCE